MSTPGSILSACRKSAGNRAPFSHHGLPSRRPWHDNNKMKTWIAAILGAASTLNGVFMLMAGSRWYETIPGVTHTGPFNPHFVADIGAAYLAGGLALAARAWRTRYWPAAVA